MVQKMLIDASHPEETRVAVVDGNKLEDFDYETQARKQLRGNIYLAKVTRVEPSLQAAFVEYGGNRHGFLAFNEIHPDYYQIPFEDRQKLLEEEERDAREHEEEEARAHAQAEASGKAARTESPADDAEHADAEDDSDSAHDGDDHGEGENYANHTEHESGSNGAAPAGDAEHEEEATLLAEQAAKRRRRAMRSYKIQEVIKRRQILLVQVVKEERGNKGAALTTYLSLAGRYCVLMPNTHRGGGISRKISDNADRRRLKEVVESLNLAEGMGVIIRTAGFSRTKAEIKRDYEYLLRLWERIREETLRSTAPSLIYEEGNLIKRAIRDLYDKDFECILVEGDDAYRQAKDFMRVLIPSHAKKVQPYRDRTPLFMKHGVEQQIDQIYQPVVQLKSGGYLVINQTEALVAIDVNSGRSTKERNIETTALKTNLEAADEACRQMRLRDLAGLIVIDFIDMEENKNNRAVEKRMRDALQVDRSRIQVGKISQFGLLEMSRQRRRTSLFEGSNEICPHCNGAGFVRSNRSAALAVLRALEEEALKKRSALVRVKAPANVALYLLNEKRSELQLFENNFGMCAHIEVDASLTPPDFKLERLEALTSPPPGVADERVDVADFVEPEEESEDSEREEAEGGHAAERQTGERQGGERQGERQGGERGGRRRRRRRGRRPEGERAGPGEAIEAERGDESADAYEAAAADDENMAGDAAEIGERAAGTTAESEAEAERKRRRRGRRGGRGRRNRRDGNGEVGAEALQGGAEPEGEDQAEGMEVVEPQADDVLTASDTTDRARPRQRAEPTPIEDKAEAEAEAVLMGAAEDDAEAAASFEEPVSDAEVDEAEALVEAVQEPELAPEPEPEPVSEPVAAAEPAPAAPKQPVKRGWWQKRGAQ
jgi:ribonuclease E